MNVGMRHRPAPSLGRAAFALMSVIALLALACFPVLAHAECVSSSCVQYTESIPKAEGEHAQSHKQETPAKASKAPHGSTNAPGGDEGMGGSGSGEEESSSKGPGAAGGSNGGGSQGNQGGSPKNGAKHVTPGNGSSLSAQPAPDSSGGSSPLVPILIAIAVLAAISVAAVMIRQRRQRRGPAGTPSPEAN